MFARKGMMFLNKIDNFKCMECGNLSSIPRIYVERMRRAELLTECVVCAIGRRGVITSPPLGIMAPLHPLPGFWLHVRSISPHVRFHWLSLWKSVLGKNSDVGGFAGIKVPFGTGIMTDWVRSVDLCGTYAHRAFCVVPFFFVSACLVVQTLH